MSGMSPGGLLSTGIGACEGAVALGDGAAADDVPGFAGAGPACGDEAPDAHETQVSPSAAMAGKPAVRRELSNMAATLAGAG